MAKVHRITQITIPINPRSNPSATNSSGVGRVILALPHLPKSMPIIATPVWILPEVKVAGTE
jgi:hypothetical protein